MLTCPLSELRGVEFAAALISYIVMSLLPLLPILGKAGGGGITLASKVGVSMQEQDNFFRNKTNPRKLAQAALGVGAGVTRIS